MMGQLMKPKKTEITGERDTRAWSCGGNAGWCDLHSSSQGTPLWAGLGQTRLCLCMDTGSLQVCLGFDQMCTVLTSFEALALLS